MTGRSRANGEGSIFPYRNGFAAYAWVTKPNGLRQRKYVYGKTREEVHDRWIDLLKTARDGPVATKVPTLGDFLQYWLREVVEPNLAPLTASTYETLVRLYIAPGLGAKGLAKLQTRDIQEWINRVRRACQCCAQGKDASRPAAKRRCCAVGQCCGQVLAPRSVHDLRTVLRAALGQAVSEELIPKNPATLVKVPSARSRKSQAWSSDEARAFLESARDDRDPLYAAYVLVLVLGLRKGEVLGLTWRDIDLDAAELTVGLQLQRVKRQLLHRQTKTEASDATLPLPEICVAALRSRQGDEESDRIHAAEAWQATGLTFTTRYGSPIDPRNFNRAWDARVAKAGVRKITVHDARRTCATLLADLDVHPRVAMQIMRHADFAITMEIYTKVSSKATREALKKLGESLDR
jgi:integrase